MPHGLPHNYLYQQVASVPKPNLSIMMPKKVAAPFKVPPLPQAEGFDWSGAAMGVAGAGMLAADTIGMANQSLNLGDPEQQYFDGESEPTYNLGQYYSQAASSKPQGATGGEVLGQTAKYAALGTQIMPGLGTAIGAGVGALSSLIGGGVRKRKQRGERQKALGKVATQQQNYNTASKDYWENLISEHGYRERANPYKRMTNLYNYE